MHQLAVTAFKKNQGTDIFRIFIRSAQSGFLFILFDQSPVAQVEILHGCPESRHSALLDLAVKQYTTLSVTHLDISTLKGGLRILDHLDYDQPFILFFKRGFYI